MENLHLSVDLSFQQLLNVVKQLSSSEKLKLNDALWEDNIEIPVEHQAIVMERMEDAKKHPETMLKWKDVLKTL